MMTKGVTLLSGNIFCGHCRRRLTSDNANSKRTKKNGEIAQYKNPSYSCAHGSQNAGKECQRKYVARIIDNTVRSVLQQVFEQIRETPPADYWNKQHERLILDIKNKIKTTTRNISKLDKDLASYKSEVLKVIQGESAFTAEILNQLIKEVEEKISKQSDELKRLQTELDESDMLYEKTKTDHERIRSWAEIFDESSPEAQKMAAASLINAVRVRRGYHIEIDFNIPANEFVENLFFVDDKLNVMVGE